MKSSIKRHLLFWSSFIIAIFLIVTTWQLQTNLAADVRIVEGSTYYVNLDLPFIYMRASRDGVVKLNGSPLSKKAMQILAPVNLQALSLGEVDLEISLFGLIPLRQITVNILPEIRLVPGGHSIGIRLSSRGVTVVGYYYFESGGQNRSPSRESGIRVGDVIIAIDGQKVTDINQAAELLNKADCKPQIPIVLTLLRDENEKTLSVTPLYSEQDGGYRIGLYIRDSAAGVGTLSFYDPVTGCYGALGHIIVDADTNKPVNIQEGNIVKAKIVNIKTAQKGKPGEKTGIFIDQNGFKGNIEQNTPYGIFGRLDSLHPSGAAIPMALASQVETGPAEMLTVIEGETIGCFQVEIERLAPQTRPSDKGFILKVVDKKLLAVTGGIVQGMSGSPIIQKGRIIGAVTHVFINDPTRGYGIFMEWMYRAGDREQETGNRGLEIKSTGTWGREQKKQGTETGIQKWLLIGNICSQTAGISLRKSNYPCMA